MGLAIKKNDTVMVIAGKEKGKKGRIISIDLPKQKVIIERMNLIKKHLKPSKQNQQGGIIDKEAPIHVSNVMLICTKCGKPTRIGNKLLENDKKVRVCKKCQEVID